MRSVLLWERAEVVDRRGFLRAAGLGGLGLLASGSGLFAAPVAGFDPSSVTCMAFDVTYRTEVHSLPRDAEQAYIWMPLPPSDDAQEVADLSITCPAGYEITSEEVYGNRMVLVKTGPQAAPFALESRYRIVRHRTGARRAALDEASARKYLRLSQRARVTEEVEAFTRRVVGGAGRPAEVGRRVYDALLDLLTYDRQIEGCGLGDTAWVMKHRRGKCDDYHALFMAMMVSRGIPVRWEQGFPLPYPSPAGASGGQLSGDCSGAHCWVSFYDPDLGWVPVDVSEADKRPEMREFFFGRLTPNRFKISEGRAITMNPPQGGDALPTFAYAYAEADGIPLIYPSNYENVVRFHVVRVETS